MTNSIRKELGDFMSTECFRYLRMGAEDTAGRALIVAAGRQRGHSLKDSLQSVSDDIPTLVQTLDQILGKNGTRLCLVDNISPTSNGYRVEISESACSTGVVTDTPNCAFTLGVFIGALEVAVKKRLIGHESECVACGAAHCVYNLEFLN